MKGITPLISLVLITSIAISLATAGYLYFSNIQKTLERKGSVQLNTSLGGMLTELKIEAFDSEEGYIYIRNTGTEPIPNGSISIYVDEKPAEILYTEPIAPKKTGKVRINISSLSEGEHILKVGYGGKTTGIIFQYNTTTTSTISTSTTSTTTSSTSTSSTTTSTTTSSTSTSSTTTSTTSTSTTTTTLPSGVYFISAISVHKESSLGGSNVYCNALRFCPIIDYGSQREDIEGEMTFNISSFKGTYVEEARICAYLSYSIGYAPIFNYIEKVSSSTCNAAPSVNSPDSSWASSSFLTTIGWKCIPVTDYVRESVSNGEDYIYLRWWGNDLNGATSPLACFLGFVDSYSGCTPPAGTCSCKPYLQIKITSLTP